MKRVTLKTRGRPAEYPWDQWLRGAVLVRGVDFSCRPSSLRVMAYSQAKRRGLNVKVYIDGSVLVIGANNDPSK